MFVFSKIGNIFIRDFTALIAPMTFFEQQLSRLHKPGPEDTSMASRRVLPAYTMTDRDLAVLNALCKVFNGMK